MKRLVVADGELRVLDVEGLDVGFRNLGMGYVLIVVVLRGEDCDLHARRNRKPTRRGAAMDEV